MTAALAAWRRHGFRIAVIGAALCAGLAPASASAQGENGSGRNIARADRVDVMLTLQADGALRVRERLDLTIGDRRTSRVERVIRESHQESIRVLGARVDGVDSLAGGSPDGTGSVSVRGQNPLRVRWTVDLAPQSRHVFELEYVATGVLGVDGAHGRLRWPAIQPDRGYPVEHAEITFVAAPGTLFYSGTGVAEDGWTVQRTPDGFTAVRANLPPKAGGTFLAEVAIDAATLPRPRWQDDERRALDLMPAFLSGGLFILVIAAGILWIVRFQYPSERVAPRDSYPAEEPIPPALAVALADRGRELRLPILGTAIDLAARGLVTFEADDRSHLRVRVVSSRPALASHEAVVFDALTTVGGADVARGRVTSALLKAARPFKRAVRADLREAGYVDEERSIAGRNLRIGGLVSIALGGVCAGLVAWLLPRFGPWPYAMPGAFVLGGLALVIAGAVFSRLNADGERAAAAWRLRTRALRRLRGAEADAESIETAIRWLPLAAAAGHGSDWVSRFTTRLRGVDAALPWWTPRAGDARAESLRAFMQEVERALKPKAH